MDFRSPSNLPLQMGDIERLQGELNSPHKIATARMFYLGLSPQGKKMHDMQPIDGGLAFYLVQCLSQSIDEWLKLLSNLRKHSQEVKPAEGEVEVEGEEKKEDNSTSQRYSSIGAHIATEQLRSILALHLSVSAADGALAEEMAVGCGSHRHLSKLIRMDVYDILDGIQSSNPFMTKTQYEDEEDTLVALQDFAAEVAHCDPSISYPAKHSPFELEELHSRLPLVFNVTSPLGKHECVLVKQITQRQSAQEDVGFVMWPSAVVLASWILDHEDLIVGKNILEIGAGCGLTGLVAARIAVAGDIGSASSTCSKVILSDFNRKVLMNIDRNIALNGLSDVARPVHLDFFLQPGDNRDGGWKGTNLESFLVGENKDFGASQPPVDLILAADTICKPQDAVAVSDTIHDALIPGGEAIVVSANAKHRFGIDIFEQECQRNALEVTTINVADMCEGKLMPKDQDSEDPCSIRKTSGFVDGMALTMFRVRKPISFKDGERKEL
jgi:predicted nicotinamide N-methyase